jgi:hypothetical protein
VGHSQALSCRSRIPRSIGGFRNPKRSHGIVSSISRCRSRWVLCVAITSGGQALVRTGTDSRLTHAHFGSLRWLPLCAINSGETGMQFQLADNPTNWDNWNKLVMDWVRGDKAVPASVNELRAALADSHVTADIPAAVQTVNLVKLVDGAINIVLPTRKMVDADQASLPVGQPYPLPKFYRVAFNNSAPGQLGNNDMQKFAMNRLGEYTIQECQ